MKIMLITPKSTRGWPNYCPPIGLCYLKAVLLRAGYQDVTVMDLAGSEIEDVRGIIREKSPDIVGITSFTETRHHALKTAAIVKEVDPKIKTIMGGVHATLMYRQVMEHYPYIDIISLGESENTAVELMGALESRGDLSKVNGIVFRRDGETVVTGKRELIKDLDSLPFPNYDDLDLTIYKEGYHFGRGKSRFSIVTSRGCQFSCIFCATHPVWGNWRPRSAKNVLDEMEWLVRDHGAEIFSIADDLFTFNRERTIEICEGIVNRGLHIQWSAQTRTDCVTPEILKLMKEAGCKVLQFGVESGSPTILKNLNKKEKIDVAFNALTWAKAAGIQTQCNIIVGGPGENKATIKETKDFIKKTRPVYIGPSCLRMFPGTELWQRGEAQGLCNESFFLTEQECIYYTGAMSFPEMLRTLSSLLLFHAWTRGLPGLFRLAQIGLSQLSQTPKKIISGLLSRK